MVKINQAKGGDKGSESEEESSRVCTLFDNPVTAANKDTLLKGIDPALVVKGDDVEIDEEEEDDDGEEVGEEEEVEEEEEEEGEDTESFVDVAGSDESDFVLVDTGVREDGNDACEDGEDECDDHWKDEEWLMLIVFVCVCLFVCLFVWFLVVVEKKIFLLWKRNFSCCVCCFDSVIIFATNLKNL